MDNYYKPGSYYIKFKPRLQQLSNWLVASAAQNGF